MLFLKRTYEVKDVSNGFSLKYSVGTGILHDGENKVSVAAIPTNQFQFSDLSLDTQLYVTENKVNYYNFYEISASDNVGETSWEEFANENAAKIAENPKTKELIAKLNVCGLNNCLVIDGKEVDLNFALASRNIVGVDVLPTIGANVYDILRKEKLVLTKDAVACLEERLQ